MPDNTDLVHGVQALLDQVQGLRGDIDTERGTVLSRNIRNLLEAAKNSVKAARTEFDAREERDAITATLAVLTEEVAAASAAAQAAGRNAQVDESLFSGAHAAGGTHRLPVHNMVESGFIADGSSFEYQAEILRFLGGSGLIGARQYTAGSGFDPIKRPFDTAYACLNMHDHANYDGQPGSAEYAAVINGYYIRTRHNDYRLMHPVQGGYEDRAMTSAPDVPAAVLAKPTGINPDESLDTAGDTQAAYMADVYTNNPQDCRWDLSYLELWLEYVNGDEVSDPTDSFRHANVSNSMRDLFERGVYLNASGHKNRLENLPFMNTLLRIVDDTGVPRFARIKYRISAYPVANLAPVDEANELPPVVFVGTGDSHQHTIETQMTKFQADGLKDGSLTEVLLTATGSGHEHTIRVTYANGEFSAEDLHPTHQHTLSIDQQFSGNLPFNEAKALAGTIDSTNRFELVRDPRSVNVRGGLQELIDSRMARFRCVDLERLCEKLPGLDGAGATQLEEYTQYGLDDTLQDRDGGVLNAAYYNRRYTYAFNDASGRRTADRGFNDPTLWTAKTAHPEVVGGFSYMVPLELILRTPRESWNPYNLPEFDYSALRAEETAGNGDSSATPFSGIHERHFWFGTPYALYGDPNGSADPADTRQEAWVLDDQGTPRRVWARGVRIFDKSGERRRFPVYPVFHEYSFASVQMENLRAQFKDLLTKAADGTLTVDDVNQL